MDKKLLSTVIVLVAALAIFWVFIKGERPHPRPQPIICPSKNDMGEFSYQGLYHAPYNRLMGAQKTASNYILYIVVFYQETPPSDAFIQQIIDDNEGDPTIIFRQVPTHPTDPTGILNTTFAEQLCITQFPAYAILDWPDKAAPQHAILQGPDITVDDINNTIAQLGVSAEQSAP